MRVKINQIQQPDYVNCHEQYYIETHRKGVTTSLAFIHSILLLSVSILLLALPQIFSVFFKIEMKKMKFDDNDDDDVSSPNGVLENYFRSVEYATAFSKSTSSDSKSHNSISKHIHRWQRFIGSIKARSATELTKLHNIKVLLNLTRTKSSKSKAIGSTALFERNHQCQSFTLSELQNATNNFSHENLVGKGGYAEVYKGCLSSGKMVAIKRLARGKLDENIGDFLTEIGIMVHVDHPNTAKLIGYGIEGGMHLVLEFSQRGSLASLLHGGNGKVEWGIRYKVALGIGKGLLYLHEGCKRRIIHRDIKAANILLTMDFEPQICDFGLAKWLPEKWTHHVVSKFEGTFGYLAPEYLMHGIVDEKTDVFAFGVLLLELITGRRALDYSQRSLVMWAKPLIYKNKIKELIDPSLCKNYDTLQMNHMLLAAFLCIKKYSLSRPHTSQVLQILKGDLGCLDGMKIRRTAFIRNVYSQANFDV